MSMFSSNQHWVLFQFLYVYVWRVTVSLQVLVKIFHITFHHKEEKLLASIKESPPRLKWFDCRANLISATSYHVVIVFVIDILLLLLLLLLLLWKWFDCRANLISAHIIPPKPTTTHFQRHSTILQRCHYVMAFVYQGHVNQLIQNQVTVIVSKTLCEHFDFNLIWKIWKSVLLPRFQHIDDGPWRLSCPDLVEWSASRNITLRKDCFLPAFAQTFIQCI